MTDIILTLNRVAQTDKSTVGVLSCPKGQYLGCIIEDGYNSPKVWGETRIPPLFYRLQQRTWGGFFERYNNRFGHDFVVEIVGVPNFTNVLFHIGNFKEDTKGCLLVNEGFRVTDEGHFAGYKSTAQYLKFMKFMAMAMNSGKNVYLNIIETFNAGAMELA